MNDKTYKELINKLEAIRVSGSGGYLYNYQAAILLNIIKKGDKK